MYFIDVFPGTPKCVTWLHGYLVTGHLFKSKLFVLDAFSGDIWGPNLHRLHFCPFVISTLEWKNSQSLPDQYQNINTDMAKWNSANINYITRISAFTMWRPLSETVHVGCDLTVLFKNAAYIQPRLSSWLSESLINTDSLFANLPLWNSAHEGREK